MSSAMYPSCATFKPRVLAGGYAKGLFAQLGSAAPREGWLHEDFLKTAEATLIDEALARTGGNRTAAAKLLGLDRSTLRGKLPRG